MSFLKRKIDFNYLLYDNQGVFIKKLYCVKNANVDFASLSRFKYGATIELEDFEEIDFLKNQIQIEVVIDEVTTPLARVLLSSPRKKLDGTSKIRTIDCFSKLLILDWAKVRTRYFLAKNTNIIAEVKRLLQPYGSIDIADSDKVTSIDRDWEIGTPILDIVNDLLGTALYNSLTVKGDGTFKSEPYVLPSDRPIQFFYEENELSIIRKELEDEADLFGVANVFIRYTNSPDINPPLVAVYENHSNTSPISIENLGYEIVDAEAVDDVSSLADLSLKCKKDAVNASDKYHKIFFETAINPDHNYLNCIYFKCYGIEGKFIETNWNIECKTGGTMKHTCRKAINI